MFRQAHPHHSMQQTMPRSSWRQYHHISGSITHPILRFVWLQSSITTARNHGTVYQTNKSISNQPVESIGQNQLLLEQIADAAHGFLLLFYEGDSRQNNLIIYQQAADLAETDMYPQPYQPQMIGSQNTIDTARNLQFPGAPPPPIHEEKHMQAGEYLKSAVYGGMDGLINTLAVVVGGVGSGTDSFHIMAVGMSVIIGDGIGMALGDYLSSKSEAEYIKAEESREMWEVDNKLEEEKKEIQQLYVEKGYGENESRRLAELISHNKQAFVNIMMLEELGLAVEDSSPAINGVVTFFAFVIFGIFPLLPYLIDRATHSNPKALMIGSMCTGAFCLFALGFAKAMLLGTNKLLSGTLTLLLGAAAVAVGYGIGVALKV